MDEPALVREHHSLGSVAQIELDEDVADVRLDGRAGEIEILGDLVVRAAPGVLIEDVALAFSEVGEPGAVQARGRRTAYELLDQAPCHRRREQRLAGRDDADAGEEPFGRLVLEHEASGSGAQGVVDVLVEVEGREHEHPGVVACAGGQQLARRLDPVHARHPHVHQDDVGPEAPRGLDRLLAVARLTDDLDVVVGPEDERKARADHRLIVGDQDPDTHARSPSSGSRA